jgi:peptide chain release factor
VQWTARSPFRPEHKRKNWFVAIEVLEPVEATNFDPKDLRWEIMRKRSGRTAREPDRIRDQGDPFTNGDSCGRVGRAFSAPERETGVREAGKENFRSRNGAVSQARMKRWRAHQELERGNPVRVLGNDI